MHCRFYAPTLGPGDVRVDLPADESAHARRVLRLKQGAVIRVFNGRGLECAGVVDTIEREVVSVRIGEPIEITPEPKVSITLAQAVLKGDGMDGVVRDAVMLGVASVVPVVTERTETDLRRLSKGVRVERWSRVAVASAKQCGRSVVPEIGAPVLLREYLDGVRADLRVILAEPAAGCGEAGPERLRSLPAPGTVTILAGPEGGWSPGEAAAAAATGFLPLTLGRRTLRADAAALTAIPVLQFLWGDL